jgi:hypothetical protein
LALRFRPTVWPGQPVPVPPVVQIREVRRDGQWLLPDFDVFGGTVLVEAPPEVYLREFRDTPADDLDALAELCKLGWIMAYHATSGYEDLPVKNDDQWARSLLDLERMLWPGEPLWGGNEAERDEVAKRHLADLAFPVHATEVAWRVRAMQRVTDHFLAYRDDEPVTRAWRDCADEVNAWRNFVAFTGAALRDLHVRVEVETVGRPPPQVFDYTGLYNAGILQLVNDLAAGETVLVCANEVCRQRFIRQLGRSRYGGHRKIGTLYCSNTCARAQYQREKRRRDRAAREATMRHSHAPSI